MATDQGTDEFRANRMDESLAILRKEYEKKHGEEPSEELVEEFREYVIRATAKRDRDEHREIYDALADE